MQEQIKCTKDLNIPSFKIIQKYKIVNKMLKEYEEGIIGVAYRLTQIIMYVEVTHKKNELIKLLDKLNQLHINVTNDLNKFVNENKQLGYPNRDEAWKELSEVSYCIGKITNLKSMINSLIDIISDVERENKLTESDTKIIEESKKEMPLDYMG